MAWTIRRLDAQRCPWAPAYARAFEACASREPAEVRRKSLVAASMFEELKMEVDALTCRLRAELAAPSPGGSGLDGIYAGLLDHGVADPEAWVAARLPFPD